MVEKGYMRPLKKWLGLFMLVVGAFLIFAKEKTINYIANTGFLIGNFYISVLVIILLISGYFLLKSGTQI